MLKIPESIRPLFVEAGWFPERRVELDPAVPVGHPAAAILRSLGGLHVGSTGQGRDCAKSDIIFERLEYDELPAIEAWERLLGTVIVPLGEAHHQHEAVLIDDLGRGFGVSYVHDAFYFLGESIEVTLEGLLLGYRARPMLRPDQSSVMFYGVEITADHPTIYRYGHS